MVKTNKKLEQHKKCGCATGTQHPRLQRRLRLAPEEAAGAAPAKPKNTQLNEPAKIDS